MSALTAESIFVTERPGHGVFPKKHDPYLVAAGVKIYQGALVSLDSAGNCRPARANSADRVIGVNRGVTVDNSAGSAGDLSIRTVESAVYSLVNGTGDSAFTSADRYAPAYVIDDATVGKVDLAGARPFAGVFLGMDSTRVWIAVGAGVSAPSALKSLTDYGKSISPHQAQVISGTWTRSVSSNVPVLTRTASASTEDLSFDFGAVCRDAANNGLTLSGFKVYYKIATAAIDEVSVALYKTTFGSAGVASTGASVAGSYDAAHDTTGERAAVGDTHVLTFTLTTGVKLTGAEALTMILSVNGDAAPAGIFTLIGVVPLFTYSNT